MGVVYHTPDGVFLAHCAERDEEFEWQLRAKGQPFHRFEEAPHPAEEPFPGHVNAYLRRTHYVNGDGSLGVAHHVHYPDGRVTPVGKQAPTGAAAVAASKPWGTGTAEPDAGAPARERFR